MTDRTQHVVDAIDGALGDYAVSDDAMRWTPEPAHRIEGYLPGRHPDARGELTNVFTASELAVSYAAQVEHAQERLRAAFGIDDAALARFHEALAKVGEIMAAYGDGVSQAMERYGQTLREAGLLPDEPPSDPRARALHLRRHRNTGPARPTAERAKRPRRLG